MVKAPFSMRFVVFVAAGVTWFSTAGVSRAGQSVLLFNQEPSTSFAVTTNGLPSGVMNSSDAGVLAFTSTALPGDVVSVSSMGSAQPPSIPVALGVTGDDLGCAHAAWDINPENDITGYRLFFGEKSVEGGAAAYDDSVDVATANRSVCGLIEGTYYFAVRAFNSAGLLSGVSNEVSAFVSTGNAQPPLPPLFIAAAESGAGCLNVTWGASSDPTVTGYIVDYGTRSVEAGDTNQYDTSVDVGNALQFQVCGLSASTVYVAVRAKNNIELLSAYSVEQTVQMSSTPVAVTSFAAVQESFAVLLRWEIWTDESLRGIEVLRTETPFGAEQPLTVGGLLDPSVNYFIDNTVRPGTEYSYRIIVFAESGEFASSSPSIVRTRELELTLEQNAPNPFNPTTVIAYVLPEQSNVRLEIFDVRGSRVAILHDGEVNAGRWSVRWDGTNMGGTAVAAGTYFYRLRTKSGTLTRKMIMVK